jgi:transcriptional regulator with XRE-family HTH domain
MSGAEGQELLLPKGRTIPINGDAVRTLRIQKKLSHEYLANISNISVDRLMEIEKGGQRVYQVNFMAIAQALGLGNDWRPLHQAATEPVTQAKPSEALPRTVAVPVTLILSPDTHINETTPHEAIAAFLTTYLNLKYEVTITAVKKGSIIVELELSEEDLLRLVAAFTETRLDAIHVDAIRLPATTGPLAAGLLQIIEPTGTPADEMTDPATPEMTLTRTPAKSLAFSVEETNPDQKATASKNIGFQYGIYLKVLQLS